MGIDAFIKTHKRKYTLEFKTKAVEFYLNGRGSIFETCRVFQIQSKGQFQRWIKEYNSHELKASPGGKVRMTMTKGRKTKLQERINIVTDHIESGRSYAETAEKYDVSYQQVYQWVRKYKASGIDGLVDRRGRSKPVEEMTDIEKLRAENRILKAQLERKELENLFLKKVDEIERRRS
jgi:transposase-like protein